MSNQKESPYGFLQQHRTAFIVESILLIILGVISIALPFMQP